MPKHKKTPTATSPATPAKRSFSFLLPWLAGLLLLATVIVWFMLQRSTPGVAVPSSPAPATKPAVIKPIAESTASLVDEGQCVGCHAVQVKDWQGSHHQMAMEEATTESVLGDFNNVTFKDGSETTRFFQKDGSFWVNTPGPDGKAADFRAAYTFGVAPLQQYLLEAPGGRLQALGVAWDVEKKNWFHLYPGQGVDFKDELHWSQPQQNANFMCVECHTTGFKRNFNAQTNSYASQWQSLGVGCQSCHGPASNHLQWASKPDGSKTHGFDIDLSKADTTRQAETCGRCHARRAPLGDGFAAHKRLMDDYLPSPLTQALYELDGKIKEEVFEYGSFTQSKMFAKGVSCSNCHNPHSTELKAPGNAVCLQCHNPAGKTSLPGIDGKGLQAKNYDSPEHHQHQPGQPGSQCVDCHMPGKFYMGNDFRHDHSFSIPNPGRALKLGTPDACLGCHKETAGDKVAEQFNAWYGADKPAVPRYDESLWLIRNGKPGASRALFQQLDSSDLPAIRRATLLAELPYYPSQRALDLARRELKHADSQVRLAAIEAVTSMTPPEHRSGPIGPLLNDPVRAVRLAAASALLGLPAEALQYQPSWDKVIGEYEQVQKSLADRAEANLNLAMLYQAQGRSALVEPALRDALLRDPNFLPALVTLIQWLDGNYRMNEAQQLMAEGLKKHPQSALLHHANGLALIRRGEKTAALKELAEAARLEPDNGQFNYVMAIALHDSGDAEGAIHQLEQLLERQPNNRQARMTLIGFWRDAGQMQKVQILQAELEQLNPDDPALRQGQ
ncbi:tetratricopeptide repeat protein [Pseudomonas sp. LS44]|uniref:multiheme c-type cytochrome n=1 Tax=Pseudomonas sp. LS44 TaxID=1357074 RepID=UPI00215AFFFD|nr:multiheme c-type cytochrome [Pseudomonas sp. LS44]UVE16051.1 tetratricopeptide repeat protein [Pseudomonas sp. LS44]